jgi:hypothetical protein
MLTLGIRFAAKKEYRYRVWANVLIAVGTVVIAATGSRVRPPDCCSEDF